MLLKLLYTGDKAYIQPKSIGFDSLGCALSWIALNDESCPFYKEMKGLIAMSVEPALRELIQKFGRHRLS